MKVGKLVKKELNLVITVSTTNSHNSIYYKCQLRVGKTKFFASASIRGAKYSAFAFFSS